MVDFVFYVLLNTYGHMEMGPQFQVSSVAKLKAWYVDPYLCYCTADQYLFFFLIQFYVPFKIISAHMRRANQ